MRFQEIQQPYIRRARLPYIPEPKPGNRRIEKAGNLPCILNAANEIAVYAFLKNRLGFLEMTDVIEKTMQKISFIEKPSLDDYYQSDGEARQYAADLIQL